MSFLEDFNKRLPDSQRTLMFLSFLRIVLSDDSLEDKGVEAFYLLLAYLPLVTETLVVTRVPRLEAALKEAKIIIRHLLDENLDDDDIELIDVFLLVAAFNIAENRLDKALFLYNKAIELNHRLEDVYVHLAVAYQLASLPLRAVQTYYRALEFSPRFVQAYTGLAQTYFNSDQLDQAIEMCFKALEMDSFSAEANILLALCYKSLGNEAKFKRQMLISTNLDLNVYDQARVEALKDDDEKSLRLLASALEDDLMLSSSVKTDPVFRTLISQPRARILLEEHKFNFGAAINRDAIADSAD